MLVGRGRLVTEVETVLEKPRTLTTGTTVLQGPMMLLTTGATVLKWTGGFFLFFLYDGKPNEALDALRYICNFVKSKLSGCTRSASRLKRLCKQTCAGRMGLKD